MGDNFISVRLKNRKEYVIDSVTHKNYTDYSVVARVFL